MSQYNTRVLLPVGKNMNIKQCKIIIIIFNITTTIITYKLLLIECPPDEESQIQIYSTTIHVKY